MASGQTAAPSGTLEAQLHACLFPGQDFTPARVGQLASRLRELADSLEAPTTAQPSKRRRKDQTPREMDFGSYQQRYVALELLYLGHAYDGFARQESTEETIEGHLFAALRHTRLVPPGATWQQLCYSRGGRTDKGVSALGQVVALSLRSGARAGQPPLPPDQEVDYPSVLNTALPRDIRVTGWADVPPEFSARFSAKFREYKYFIVQQEEGADEDGEQQQQQSGAAAGADGGGARAAWLDVAAMRAAAAHFVGEHDFRNFCKVDAGHVANFVRRVLDFRIEEVPGARLGSRSLIVLHIRGTAFLWHQVRCMAAVLLMVGRGQEDPSVVAQLLDVEAHPRKPQYVMASEEALLLYRCAYQGLAFRRGQVNQRAVAAALEDMLGSHLVRAALLEAVQGKLAGDEVAAEAPHTSAGKRLRRQAAAAGRRIPLLLRAREPPLEARIQKAEAKTAAAAAVAAGGGCVGQGATADGADAPQAAEGAGDEEPGPAGGAARAAPDSVLAKQSVTGVSL